MNALNQPRKVDSTLCQNNGVYWNQLFSKYHIKPIVSSMMIDHYNYNTPELIYYHTLGVRLVRYSYATLTLHKRYKYVQNAGHLVVIRWNTSLHVAHTLRVR